MSTYYLPFDNEAVTQLLNHLDAFEDCAILSLTYLDGWYEVTTTTAIPEDQLEHLNLYLEV